MERGLCNADREGYNVIWEAGTEGTDSVGTAGAVAGVCGACMSCECEFLESSRLSLRAAQLLDQGCHVPCCCRDSGKACWWRRAWGGRAGRLWQEEGSRGPWYSCTEPVCAASSPYVGGGRKFLCAERAAGCGLASETSCDRRAEGILENGGVGESP